MINRELVCYVMSCECCILFHLGSCYYNGHSGAQNKKTYEEAVIRMACSMFVATMAL